MRKTIIAGNWKMNKDLGETEVLIKDLKKATLPKNVMVIVCPPYTSLAHAHQLSVGTALHLGAQDVSVHEDGAYTGEISIRMLKSVGCRFVIVGHSERRQYFHESDKLINEKAKKVLAAGLLPIICVGETLDEREKGITTSVVSKQINGVLDGLSAEQIVTCVIAYEPVWAIGTGKTATPAQAEEVHLLIRKLLSDLYSGLLAQEVTIQYGGSVKPENAKELLSQPNIDGALVGGACLKADSFIKIIEAGSK